MAAAAPNGPTVKPPTTPEASGVSPLAGVAVIGVPPVRPLGVLVTLRPSPDSSGHHTSGSESRMYRVSADSFGG